MNTFRAGSGNVMKAFYSTTSPTRNGEATCETIHLVSTEINSNWISLRFRCCDSRRRASGKGNANRMSSESKRSLCPLFARTHVFRLPSGCERRNQWKRNDTFRSSKLSKWIIRETLLIIILRRTFGEACAPPRAQLSTRRRKGSQTLADQVQ